MLVNKDTTSKLTKRCSGLTSTFLISSMTWQLVLVEPLVYALLVRHIILSTSMIFFLGMRSIEGIIMAFVVFSRYVVESVHGLSHLLDFLIILLVKLHYLCLLVVLLYLCFVEVFVVPQIPLMTSFSSVVWLSAESEKLLA